ncbi:MAG: hypothetical protein ABJF23_29550, partial [Bryobacteraceae bacterium]
MKLDSHRDWGFSLADIQRVPGARHPDVKKPDHRVSLWPVPLVGGVSSAAEIRKDKDDICLPAFDGVNRSDNHP